MSLTLESAPPPSAQGSIIEEEFQTLPPVVVTNPRIKIESELIPATELLKKTHPEKIVENHPALRFIHKFERGEPIPRHPLAITWYPKVLCYKLDEDVVTKKLTISNRSSHILYVCSCGLWDDTARLGASWYLNPRTRFLLAPGMVGHLFVRAVPRESSPVPRVGFTLQLAASFPRDSVVGYFAVPIDAKFFNYVEPEMYGEGG